ncbi:unnamed protein product [Moneuplotes crassus]|uniref:Uncharacterized protein n=1 Tax=Euplotes crassus TaxID=5936 RepID=A0AAD2DB14_EUPCR|nr:unnamed protein product [Moneuplotes crassus]
MLSEDEIVHEASVINRGISETLNITGNRPHRDNSQNFINLRSFLGAKRRQTQSPKKYYEILITLVLTPSRHGETDLLRTWFDPTFIIIYGSKFHMGVSI